MTLPFGHLFLYGTKHAVNAAQGGLKCSVSRDSSHASRHLTTAAHRKQPDPVGSRQDARTVNHQRDNSTAHSESFVIQSHYGALYLCLCLPTLNTLPTSSASDIYLVSIWCLSGVTTSLSSINCCN